MAIVQISRVQIRRGRKNSAVGIPQLASGEMGWSIDTQQLFIGNGSVAEGSPSVGNTEILTEHTNIFDVAGKYVYKKNNPVIQTGYNYSTPTRRSLQERLDDRLSVKSFGAVGGIGDSDDSDAIQRAIDQLYLNIDRSLPQSRVILHFEAGVYTVTRTILIPPYAEIRGEGKDKTIIRQAGAFPLFRTVGMSQEDMADPVHCCTCEGGDITTATQPRYITVADMTLQQTVLEQPVFQIISTRDSRFENLKFVGLWDSGEVIRSGEAGVNLRTTPGFSIIPCERNLFLDCDFVNLSHAVESDHPIRSNIFMYCNFFRCGRGVAFGIPDPLPESMPHGPYFNRIAYSTFTELDREGIFIRSGTGNISQNNIFQRVGNDGGSNVTAIVPVIRFDETGNVSTGDFFDRAKDLGRGDDSHFITRAYVGEFSGQVIGDHKFNMTGSPNYTLTPKTLFRLNANDNRGYKVHYLYKSPNANIVRKGTMFVVVDNDETTVRLTDEYDITSYSESVLNDLSLAENLTFTAEFDPDLLRTLNIKYVNTTTEDVDSLATFTYWYEVLS